MSVNTLHHDWLALIEISGPFLAVPVLTEAFPQGLEQLDGIRRKRLRQAYEEWREAEETDDPQFAELHAAWIDEVLSRGLELDEDGKGDVLKRADWCTANLSVSLAEHGATLAPDLAVIDEQRADKPLMLIHTYGQDVDLDATLKLDGWAATPAERMVQLCRATGCRLGLVTNGERWMLVDAPVGAMTTFASWYARIWGQEPITLQAFVHLLGIRRFFVDEAEQLPALFDRSLKYQDEVTDALGEQVRRAVEVLIQSLDKADQDRDRELLRDVKEPELYEAALTVMMRLVFLLSAEERGLLLLGDERYEANYALSTLRMHLRKESEEILERRWDAWSRLLAIFRAVFGGIEHENLRLPALGGSLFDPDRFPFLEGRAKGSDWRTDSAKPLPIDNRTVLLLLEAIQQFHGRTLSYRALDVEQIGYVYEGLLERTVKRTAEITLELDGTKNAKSPWFKLAELESARMDGADRLVELLKERSGSSASRVRNDLAKPVDDTLADRLLAACHGDTNLRNRIKPFAHLVRTDPWGYPLVYPAGAFIVTTGSDRRETGTHYTPKSLTEAIVTETLTPIAYVGPADGEPREQWVLRSPAELLDLKICDPAMGSGAFLVQACRWLADRLVEAWSLAEAGSKWVSVDGEVLDAPDTKEPLPRDTEARTLIARRLIAERCLYGVDLNPLAVELAKLSIWLVTLAKGRPFGFLNHNLRCGDSLLGIHRLDQLTGFSMTPTGKGQQRLFGQNIKRAVHEAIELRQRLREMQIRDIRDVEAMARLHAEARRKLELPERIADALIGEVLRSADRPSIMESSLSGLAVIAELVAEGDHDSFVRISRLSSHSTAPFHWPLEYPEVFCGIKSGFDAIVSNPPWGAALLPELQIVWKSFEGDKLDRLVDSFHLFLIRANQLLGSDRTSFAGLLVPDVLLYQGYSQALREFLIEKCHIASVCNIGDGAFTRVTRPCCYIVFATASTLDFEISISKWGSTKSDQQHISFKLPPAVLKSFPGSIIPTNNLSEYSEVARWVSALPCKLSSLVDDYGIQRGASADNKDIFVLPKQLAASENLEDAFLRPVVTGGVHLKPFQISDDLPLLIYTSRDTAKHLIPNIVNWVTRHASKITCKEVQQGKHPIYALHRPRDERLFERKQKLLGVITADRPKVAVDTQALYAMDGVFVLAPRDGIDAYYLAGILNSSVMARIYRVFSQEEGRVMAQVKPTILAELPIVPPRSGDDSLEVMASRVAALAKALHAEDLSEDEQRAVTLELDGVVESLFSSASISSVSTPFL
ncbi:Eco57I restriction-modification methylase domain-containing protein [Pseudomonas aeruginosa]|uniref:Eco57I restriction-modification methylase domain-containing protein n=1 Tax=Pseudomonas aeruginosa TaxID=287 RepID=UPI0009A918B7|nr:TaqI-like C-terminal specificity domain-containing protein [Pseudomonas aeruginosa]